MINIWNDIPNNISVNEQVYCLSDRHKKDDKLDTSDLGKLQARLISFAKNNKLTSKDWKKFSKSIDKDEESKSYDRISKMELGYCFKDRQGNFVLYSEKGKNFYYMDMSLSGFENTRKPISIKKIKTIVDKEMN